MISPAELEQLWRENSAVLELLARARCSAPEDCVQEAFIKLAAQPLVPRDPRAWLYRVVRNAAINHSRSDRRRRRHEQQAAEQRTVWLQPAPGGTTNGIAAEALKQALLQLDANLRDVLIAAVWGGMSFRQIGEAFECSQAAAHRRYVQALAALRRRLPDLEHHWIEDSIG